MTANEVENFFIKYPDAYLISSTKFEKELGALPLKKIFQKKDLFESPVTTVYIKQQAVNK